MPRQCCSPQRGFDLLVSAGRERGPRWVRNDGSPFGAKVLRRSPRPLLCSQRSQQRGSDAVHFLSHQPDAPSCLHALRQPYRGRSTASSVGFSSSSKCASQACRNWPLALHVAKGARQRARGRVRCIDPGAFGSASSRIRVARIGTSSGTAARGVAASLWQWRRICSARRMAALRQPEDGGSGGPPCNSIASDCRGCARRQSGLHSTGEPHGCGYN